jgi:hypothetical protein
MSKKTWADVDKGDTVELGGREYRVVKIKKGKRKAEVMVETRGRYASSKVSLADRVKLAPLHDASGAQKRWATEKERAKALRKPPRPAAGGAWDEPKGKAEKVFSRVLGARLVGESIDNGGGYYVPPVDVSTVAAHLALMHGGIPGACQDDEGKMLAAHAAQHVEAAKGAPLPVSHWHTEVRP